LASLEKRRRLVERVEYGGALRPEMKHEPLFSEPPDFFTGFVVVGIPLITLFGLLGLLSYEWFFS
jgi:hypothetical protein